MNQYTQILYYIKQLAESDILINTVTQGEFDRLDLNKGNLFPLVHIAITSGGFTNGQTVKFTIEIAALAVRDKVNETVTDKFWLQDNEVDNMNEMLAVLNRMWTIMYRDFESNDITASENPSLTPLFESKKNLLDGWLLTFDIELPNTTLYLC